MKKIGRLLTAMVTPFDEGEGVDYGQAKRLALALLDSGSDGVVISGTTGESPTLSREEKLRLFVEIKDAVGNKGSVVAGTGSYNTKESSELTKEAERIGVDAALLVVPYYNKPTQQGLLEHFQTIAKGTNLPCILYNVPTRTITNLTAETTIKLSQIDNIIGIKEASGDMKQIAKIIKGTSDDFLVCSGNDSDTLSILKLGGYGVVSVASHLVGNHIKEMIEAFEKGDINQAESIHRFLSPLVKTLFLVSNPIPVKYALNYIGFQVGRPRLPLTPPDALTAATIKAVLKHYRKYLSIPVEK